MSRYFFKIIFSFFSGDRSKVICSFCDKVIPKMKYTDHCLTLHSNLVDCFSCDHCNKKFIDRQAFISHRERNHAITDKQNYCKKCRVGKKQFMP